MPIIVPEVSVEGRKYITIPAPPSEPPTFIDVARAIQFSHKLAYQYESKLGVVFISSRFYWY